MTNTTCGGIKTVRKNRRPSTTPTVIHEFADEKFQQMFGWKARSEGLFCAGTRFKNKALARYDTPHPYGTWYQILPFGIIEYVWSPDIFDFYFLYQEVKDMVSNRTRELSLSRLIDETKDELDTAIDNANYQDHNLKAALKSGSEIMVKCDKYIIMRPALQFEIER